MFKILFLFFLLVSPFNWQRINISAYSSNNLRTCSNIQKKDSVKWFNFGPYLINGDEYYSFSNDEDTNHTPLYPTYGPYSVGPVFLNFAVNESSYPVSATDSTNESVILSPQYNKTMSVEMYGQGTVGVTISFDSHLPQNCEISIDTRNINDCDSYFHLNTNANPTIDTGIVLYRQSTNGVFSGWDGYVPLSSFVNGTAQLNFYSGYIAQIAILYEINNYDNGWWIFQQHAFFHNIALYCFAVVN